MSGTSRACAELRLAVADATWGTRSRRMEARLNIFRVVMRAPRAASSAGTSGGTVGPPRGCSISTRQFTPHCNATCDARARELGSILCVLGSARPMSLVAASPSHWWQPSAARSLACSDGRRKAGPPVARACRSSGRADVALQAARSPPATRVAVIRTICVWCVVSPCWHHHPMPRHHSGIQFLAHHLKSLPRQGMRES